MRAQIASLVCLAATGCAVPSTGIVPQGEGLLTIARQGSGAWVSTDSLKAEALREADAYCAKDQRALKVIHTKETQAGPFGRWPESEVLFKCE
jgi:hypothetical protein